MRPIIDSNLYLIAYLQSHPHTPHARPLRVCTRGVKGFEYAWMAGGVTGTMETTEEVDRLMREIPKGATV